MRLFVSIDLPDDLAEGVAAVQEELADASGLTFPDPEQAHLTLKFLGDTPENRLSELEAAVSDAVEDAAVEPFEATFGGLGAFPSSEYIRVVWLGVESGGEEMTRLAKAVEERTTAIGFSPESYDFTPHVTLARMEHAGGKERVQEAIRTQDPTVGSMDVSEIRLTKSELTSEGPIYSTVERFSLG